MRRILHLLKEGAWPFGLVGGLYGYFVRLIPDVQVGLWQSTAACAFLLSIVILLAWHLSRRDPQKQQTLRVDSILEPGSIFLTEPTEALGIDMGAKVYHKDGEHYLLIGEGVVTNVQPNKRCSLQVKYLENLNPLLLGKIAENNENTRKSLVMRPGIILTMGQF